MFNLPLSQSIDLEFNPNSKDGTFRFKSWAGPRQLSLTAEEVLALVQLIQANAEKITQAIEQG